MRDELHGSLRNTALRMESSDDSPLKVPASDGVHATTSGTEVSGHIISSTGTDLLKSSKLEGPLYDGIKSDETELCEDSEASSEEKDAASGADFGNSILQEAINLVTKAVKEDKKRNFEVAHILYEEGVVHFVDAIKYEAESDSSKETIRFKCAEYLERARKIKTFLIHRQKRKAVEDSKWDGNEEENDSGSDSDEDIDNVVDA